MLIKTTGLKDVAADSRALVPAGEGLSDETGATHGHGSEVGDPDPP